jgi:polysaccharide export outer membrane protein
VLRGAVARPGGYQWRSGQKISDLVGSIDDDLLTETDLSTGLIVRRTGLGLEVEVLGFDLGDAVANPGGSSDLALKARDELLIFALPYLNDSYKELTARVEEGADGD